MVQKLFHQPEISATFPLPQDEAVLSLSVVFEMKI